MSEIIKIQRNAQYVEEVYWHKMLELVEAAIQHEEIGAEDEDSFTEELASDMDDNPYFMEDIDSIIISAYIRSLRDRGAIITAEVLDSNLPEHISVSAGGFNEALLQMVKTIKGMRIQKRAIEKCAVRNFEILLKEHEEKRCDNRN